MPATGQAYPVTDAWRRRVERELAKRGWSRAELARRIGCAPATITHLLTNEEDGGVKQSPYVASIHKLFNWSLPRKADDGESDEVDDLMSKLSEVGRARWIERGKAILEDEQKKR